MSSLVPNYEVKLLLEPSKVLESDDRLNNAIRSAFNIQQGTKKMNVIFMDTEKQHIYNVGWSLRIRKSENDNKFELTYKKRYPVGEGLSAATAGSIDATLETAKQEGFGSSYKAQVEVGYKKQTLSISRDEEIPSTSFQGTDLPSVIYLRRFLRAKVPDEFKNWSANNWGTKYLDESIVYGPVLAKRSKGTWEGFELSIEVWPIRKSRDDASLELIVEASFKTPDFQKAVEGHANLERFLRERGWLLEEDSLKTKLIMERYGVTT
ncbi:hypothetical protein LTR70_007382 [Exophiala xenobiotica]|nr:hypothetical protein LTR70_007382 [Exophiala xenobiotica]